MGIFSKGINSASFFIFILPCHLLDTWHATAVMMTFQQTNYVQCENFFSLFLAFDLESERQNDLTYALDNDMNVSGLKWEEPSYYFLFTEASFLSFFCVQRNIGSSILHFSMKNTLLSIFCARFVLYSSSICGWRRRRKEEAHAFLSLLIGLLQQIYCALQDTGWITRSTIQHTNAVNFRRPRFDIR